MSPIPRITSMLLVAWLSTMVGVAGCASSDHGPSGSADPLRPGGHAPAPAGTHAASSELIDEKTYEELLIEWLITNQSYTTQSDSAVVDSARKALLARYGVTEERFMATHRQMEKDSEAQMQRMLRIKDRIQTEMMSISDHIREQEAAVRARQDSIRDATDPSRQQLRMMRPGS